MLKERPHTASTLKAVQHIMLSQQLLVFDDDLVHWVVVLVTDLPLIEGVAQAIAVDVVTDLTKALLVRLRCSG